MLSAARTALYGLSPGWKSFLAAFLYFAVSIALTLLNKAVFASYDFRASRVLALAQMVFSIAFLHAFDKAGLIKLPTLNQTTALLISPLAVSYVAMMICGFDAMRGTNLVMFDTLRRTTIVFVIVVEYIFMKSLPSYAVMGTSLVCLIGTIIAGATDLTFDPYGYFMAFLTNLSTSLYIVLIRWVKSKAPNSASLDSFAMLYYNVILSLPFLTLYSLWNGDLATVMEYPYLFDPGFLCVFGFSSVLGFVINYSVFLNTLVNSPLTQVITGQAKSVGVLSLGAIIFKDAKFTPTNTLGIVISVIGGALYAWVKFDEGEKEKAEKERLKAEARALESVSIVSSNGGGTGTGGGGSASPGSIEATTLPPAVTKTVDSIATVLAAADQPSTNQPQPLQPLQHK